MWHRYLAQQIYTAIPRGLAFIYRHELRYQTLKGESLSPRGLKRLRELEYRNCPELFLCGVLHNPCFTSADAHALLNYFIAAYEQRRENFPFALDLLAQHPHLRGPDLVRLIHAFPQQPLLLVQIAKTATLTPTVAYALYGTGRPAVLKEIAHNETASEELRTLAALSM